jgi:hypothetical protein
MIDVAHPERMATDANVVQKLLHAAMFNSRRVRYQHGDASECASVALGPLDG